MKLRIRGNSIRLRLDQKDVKVFKEQWYLEQSIQFGIGAGGKLTYVIATADIPKLKSEYKENMIKVWVPKKLAYDWVNSQIVGMEHLATTSDDTKLKILVEKDFKCLQVRINEDESKSFPHPKEKGKT